MSASTRAMRAIAALALCALVVGLSPARPRAARRAAAGALRMQLTFGDAIGVVVPSVLVTAAPGYYWARAKLTELEHVPDDVPLCQLIWPTKHAVVRLDVVDGDPEPFAGQLRQVDELTGMRQTHELLRARLGTSPPRQELAGQTSPTSWRASDRR